MIYFKDISLLSAPALSSPSKFSVNNHSNIIQISFTCNATVDSIFFCLSNSSIQLLLLAFQLDDPAERRRSKASPKMNRTLATINSTLPICFVLSNRLSTNSMLFFSKGGVAYKEGEHE